MSAVNGAGGPETSAEIDRLAEAARVAMEHGDTEPQIALWSAMFSLERWWFPTTEGDDPRPFLGVLPEGPALIAFTTGERARAWALGNGFEEERASRVLSMSPSSTLQFVEQVVPQGVKLFLVDAGVTGFFVPIEALAGMKGFLEGHGGETPGGEGLGGDPDA